MFKKISLSILKIIGWLALMFGTQMIGMFIAGFIMTAMGVFDETSLNTLMEALSQGVSYESIDANILYLLGELSNYCIIVAFIPYIFILLKNRKKHFKKIPGKTFIKLLGFGILANFIISIILVLLTPIIPEGFMNDLNMSTDMASNGNILLTALATGIIGPIIEEVTLRRGVYRSLKNFCPVYIALLIQAIIFGIMHGNLIQGIYAGVLGFIFGLFYETSEENLIVPIILHITINMTSVLLTVFI